MSSHLKARWIQTDIVYLLVWLFVTNFLIIGCNHKASKNSPETNINEIFWNWGKNKKNKYWKMLKDRNKSLNKTKHRSWNGEWELWESSNVENNIGFCIRWNQNRVSGPASRWKGNPSHVEMAGIFENIQWKIYIFHSLSLSLFSSLSLSIYLSFSLHPSPSLALSKYWSNRQVL